jgi:hypothetical protein
MSKVLESFYYSYKTVVMWVYDSVAVSSVDTVHRQYGA